MHKAEAHLVLPALIAAMAAAADLLCPENPTKASPCELWAQAAVESACPNDGMGPYTIVRQFAGVPVNSGPNIIALQIYTLGKTPALAVERAAKVFNSLLDDDDVEGDEHDWSPRRGWIIGSGSNQWEVDVFDLMEGGLIGADDRGRAEVVSNFELGYRRHIAG